MNPPAPTSPPAQRRRVLSSSLMARYVDEMRLRNYSPRSIRTYRACLRRFVEYFPHTHPRELTPEQIRGFLLGVLEAGRSRSLVDQYISAVRLLYIDLYGWSGADFGVTRPKREQKLPYVPTRSEILEMAARTPNPKHQLAILFLYSTGLRVSEFVAATIADLAPDRLSLRVRNGKGAKDRRTVVSPSLREDLDWLTYRRTPDEPLFPSQHGGHWSTRSVQRVISAAGVRAGIEHRVTCHSLRHAFATHLLEGGTQLFHIQGLLGHKSIATTTRYTRMVDPASARIVSPL